MSREAMTWVLEEAPEMPPHLLGVAMGLANHAGRDGRGAYPRQDRIAWYARKSDRAVRNDLATLADLGLIRYGDQSLVAHLPADERPTVWDLALERKRDPYPTERKSTSGTDRKHSSTRERNPTSGPEGDGSGSGIPGGSTLPAGSEVPGERKQGSEGTGSTLPINRPMNQPGTSPPSGESRAHAHTREAAADPDDDPDALFAAAPAEPPTPAAPRRRKPLTTPPDVFPVTDEMRAWARDHRRGITVDLEDQTERFLNHARLHDRRCRDWIAAWRNWILKGQDFAEQNGQRAATGTDGIAGYGARAQVNNTTNWDVKI